MNVIYRPRKGGLKKSMAEAKVFDSAEDMLQYVSNEYVKDGIKSSFFVDYDKSTSDKRTGWKNTHEVYGYMNNPSGFIAGYCSFDYNS